MLLNRAQAGTSRSGLVLYGPVGAGLILAIAIGTAPDDERLKLAGIALVGALAGISATSVGVFGGVLVPGLLILGLPARSAALLSLVLQAAVIPLGAASHAALGHVRRSITIPLILGGVVGSVSGAALTTIVPERVATRLVALAIVVVGVVVLAAIRIRPGGSSVPASAVQRRIVGTGFVAGVCSGVSGAGWGPIGVKLLLLLRIEPRLAIGSSLVGRVPIALAAILTYALTSIHREDVGLDLRILVVLAASSGGAMLPGTSLVNRIDRNRLSIGIAILSIALALPSLVR